MLRKLLTYLIFPAIIVVLAYSIFESIMTPVRFENELNRRKEVAIQRLKDIRDLQVMFKSVNGRYTADIDSLIDMYNNGQMTVVRQIGSMDDSLAVAQKRVFRDSVKISIKDTLFHTRTNFRVDSLKFIPFSGKAPVQLQAVVRIVSGVNVPLFEACMPYNLLLNGMDQQLIINLNADQEAMHRYQGLMVGSIDSPNNNAGNWE